MGHIPRSSTNALRSKQKASTTFQRPFPCSHQSTSTNSQADLRGAAVMRLNQIETRKAGAGMFRTHRSLRHPTCARMTLPSLPFDQQKHLYALRNIRVEMPSVRAGSHRRFQRRVPKIEDLGTAFGCLDGPNFRKASEPSNDEGAGGVIYRRKADHSHGGMCMA